MKDDKKILATKTLTNVGGLAIYELSDEEVLVGYNDETPERVALEWDEQGLPYFNYYGVNYLNEFIKCNIGEQ